MSKLTEILAQADVLFDLRPALESFGFDEDADIFFVFASNGKECKTGAIPPSKYERSTALSLDNINGAVLAFINKTTVQFPEFDEALNEELGLSKEKEVGLEIRIISQKGGMPKNELVLSWPRRFCPCFPGAGFCCTR